MQQSSHCKSQAEVLQAILNSLSHSNRFDDSFAQEQMLYEVRFFSSNKANGLQPGIVTCSKVRHVRCQGTVHFRVTDPIGSYRCSPVRHAAIPVITPVLAST